MNSLLRLILNSEANITAKCFASKLFRMIIKKEALQQHLKCVILTL